MGLERRGNKFYYYEKRREGSKVISHYLGSGETAEIMATLAGRSHRERLYKEACQREAEQAARVKDEQMAGEMESANQLIQMLTRAALIITEHHTHKGSWRKKR